MLMDVINIHCNMINLLRIILNYETSVLMCCKNIVTHLDDKMVTGHGRNKYCTNSIWSRRTRHLRAFAKYQLHEPEPMLHLCGLAGSE
jgi:hypothetical protein